MDTLRGKQTASVTAPRHSSGSERLRLPTSGIDCWAGRSSRMSRILRAPEWWKATGPHSGAQLTYTGDRSSSASAGWLRSFCFPRKHLPVRSGRSASDPGVRPSPAPDRSRSIAGRPIIFRGVKTDAAASRAGVLHCGTGAGIHGVCGRRSLLRTGNSARHPLRCRPD